MKKGKKWGRKKRKVENERRKMKLEGEKLLKNFFFVFQNGNFYAGKNLETWLCPLKSIPFTPSAYVDGVGKIFHEGDWTKNTLVHFRSSFNLSGL